MRPSDNDLNPKGIGIQDNFDLKFSGEKQTFSTGANREVKTGKGRYDLLSPIALRRKAMVFERGAAIYGDRNWEKGFPLHSHLDSAFRHLCQYIEGLGDEDHLGQASWHIDAAMHVEEKALAGELPRELLDIGPWKRGDEK